MEMKNENSFMFDRLNDLFGIKIIKLWYIISFRNIFKYMASRSNGIKFVHLRVRRMNVGYRYFDSPFL